MDDISVYVHIPFCRCRCAYCDFVSNVCNTIPFESYTNRLIQEFDCRKSLLSPMQSMSSVYIGGGTPSIWPADQLARLLEHIHKGQKQPIEVTVELNPGDVSASWLETVMIAGANRFSLGVQAMSNSRLQRLGRRHSVDDAKNAVLVIQKVGNKNISVDFIYGTPGQSVHAMEEELLALCALQVPHISAYELTISPNTPLAKVPTESLCDEDALVCMWHRLGEILAEHGYGRYEVSNYAVPSFESLHNRHYWQGGAYVGIGSGAHGFLFFDEKRYRYGNTIDLKEYLGVTQLDATAPIGAGFIEQVTDAMFAAELVMLGLRCEEGIDSAKLKTVAGHDAQFQRQLTYLVDNQYLSLNNGRYIPTEQAMLFADSLALRFF